MVTTFPNTHRLSRVASTLMCAAMVAGLWAQSPQSKSSDTLTLHLLPVQGKPAVQLTQVLMDGQLVPLDQPFAVRPGWINHIQIVLVNLSPQSITHGQVSLLFPETQSSQPGHTTMAMPFEIGKLPGTWLRHKDGTTTNRPDYYRMKPEIAVQPGATMVFAPGGDVDQQFNAVQSKASQTLSLANIRIDIIDFANGDIWRPNSGFFAPASPPGLWKPVSEADFFANKQTD